MSTWDLTETAAGGNAARAEGGTEARGNATRVIEARAEDGTVARVGEDGNCYITLNGQIGTDYKGARYMVKGSVRPNDGETKIGLTWATIE